MEKRFFILTLLSRKNLIAILISFFSLSFCLLSLTKRSINITKNPLRLMKQLTVLKFLISLKQKNCQFLNFDEWVENCQSINCFYL